MMRALLDEQAPAWRHALLLTLLYLLSALPYLHTQYIERPDEPRYVCAARDLVTGAKGEDASDWVIPAFNGEPRLKKPVLIYWVLAGFGFLGQAMGLELSTAFRLLPVCCGWLTVLFTYGLGRRLYGPQTGLLAGLALLSTYFFQAMSREILIDPMLTASMMAGWYFFLVGLQRLEQGRDREAGLPLLAFYLCLGIACQAKGPPLVAVFAVIPMFTYLAWEWRRYTAGRGLPSFVWRSRIWYGVALALWVGNFWFYVLWRVDEWQGVEILIEQENLQRAIGQVDHNSGIRIFPFLFYLQNVPMHFLPWGLFIFPALWWSIRYAHRMTTPGRFLVCALLVPWFLMNMLGSKRSVYMLPLYPMLSLWVGRYWHALFFEAGGVARHPWLTAFSKGTLYAVAALAPLSAAVLASGAWWGLERALPFTRGEFLWAGVCAAGFAALAWRAVRWLRAGAFQEASIALLALVALLGLLKETTIRPAQERKEPKRAFFERMAKHLGEERLLWFGGSANEAVWYLNRPVIDVLPWSGLREFYYESPRPAILVARDRETERPAYAALLETSELVATLEYDDETSYLLLRPKPSAAPPEALFAMPARGFRGDDEPIGASDLALPVLFLVTCLGLSYHAWRQSETDRDA
ncbi:MAG: hypothetical protein AMXMBFR7_06610 [Planctomycetota bacterium]